jgi:hypothetical protein
MKGLYFLPRATGLILILGAIIEEWSDFEKKLNLKTSPQKRRLAKAPF